MFSIGRAEIVLILLVVLFVVGPRKLPEIARMIGKAVRYFKRSIAEVSQAIESEPPEELKKELSDFFEQKKENKPKNTKNS